MMSYLLELMRVPSIKRLKLGPEERLSVAFANTLRAHTLNGRLHGTWFHIPNEGKRSPAYGALLRAMGLLPGVPDYAFLTSDGGYLLELKVGRNKQTPHQLMFERWCGRGSVPYRVVRSVEEAETQLSRWGVLV